MSAPNRFTNLQSLRASNWDVAFSMAFITLTTGLFQVGFIQEIGGSDLWIGLIAAIPALAGIFQIPGAIWGRSFTTFKRFIAPGGWLWRLFHVPLVFLPLLPISNDAKLIILTICIAIASSVISIVNPIFNDWLAEMVPSSSRGFYFSRRNAISAGVGAVVGMAGALVLDRFRATGQDATGFSVIFGMAILCAATSMFFFQKMQDIPRPHPVKQNLRTSLAAFKVPFGDREYRRVLIFLSLFVAGQMFAGPLFAAFARESLKLDYSIIQGAVFMHAIGNVLTSRFWGFLSDRFGNKPLLTLVGYAMVLNLAPWLLCRPGEDTFNTILLWVSHLLMGATWSGVALCQLNLMLATAKPEDRANYLGAGMTVQTLIGGASPLLGAALLATFRGQYDTEWAYKSVFFVTAGIRIVAMLFLMPVKEEGSTGFRATLKTFRSFTPKGVRAMRSLKSSTDEQSRVGAIQEVGASRASMATEDVIKALHDPLPRVRRRAAAALANLKDQRAVEALLHMLKDHPDLVEEETVEALGLLGSKEASDALIGLLRHPSAMIRRAAARALARLDSQEAVPVLIQCVTESEDIDLRRAALQALRVLHAETAGPAVARAMMDQHPSVRVAAAEAVSEIGLRDAAQAVRDSLAAYSDEASSEGVYALGVVGERSDLPLVLRKAQECVSMITRRRCLLAAARLLDVEREAYRLMLQEGIARDESLIQLAAKTSRPEVARAALARYSSGDEAGALEVLARINPELQDLADTPVEEAFIVGLAALTSK